MTRRLSLRLCSPARRDVFTLTLGCILFLLAVGHARSEEGYSDAIKVETILKTGTDAGGRAIEYPREGKPQLTGLLVEIPVGQATGWHLHPSPSTAYILQGEVTVETDDGTQRIFKAGDCFAEMVNRRHCGRNTDTVPVKILMFVIGTEDVPVSKVSP